MLAASSSAVTSLSAACRVVCIMPQDRSPGAPCRLHRSALRTAVLGVVANRTAKPSELLDCCAG